MSSDSPKAEGHEGDKPSPASRAEDVTSSGSRPRPSRAPNRVTLEFVGAPLTLPGEPGEGDELVLDTGEFHVPPDPDEAPSVPPPEWLEDSPSTQPSLELDLAEMDEESPSQAEPESGDAWGRMRANEPRAERPRSVTPPALARDDALALVAERSRPPSVPQLDLAVEMRERFALGDFSGALRAAEIVLGKRSEDAEADLVAAQSRAKLIQLHTARLTSLCPSPTGELIWNRRAKVVVPETDVRWMGLDHRQGFVLSRIEPDLSIEDLVDTTGMSRLEVLHTLVELVETKALTIL